MFRVLDQRLARLTAGGYAAVLRGGLKGIEKESLRVTSAGTVAGTAHPAPLGSALTHPYITTDYSEALLELITPPFADGEEALAFLDETHRFVYAHLGSDLLWATSMPCVVAGDDSIPIAWYGTSNSGQMRHVYRRGLAHRYGKAMQIISGVHFNYSVPHAFWPAYQDLVGEHRDARSFVDAQYMGLIRNVLRYGWLLVYLFGASPAICRSFLGDAAERFSEFDAGTRYEPFATSLRMSDIGYTNRSTAGLDVRYDGLDGYVESITRAIETRYPPYESIGVQVDGEYRQLNANILQIENEFYSSVRPKQITERGEKPSVALARRGVRYVELRSLDVDPYSRNGIDPERMRFMEAFALFCLLQESPPLCSEERREIDANLLAVALRGRQPGLALRSAGRAVGLAEWGTELLGGIGAVAELLDTSEPRFRTAAEAALARVRDPERTPSARVLAEMRADASSFYHYAMATSERHRQAFAAEPLAAERMADFARAAAASIEAQAELEAADDMSFEAYLDAYFNPTTEPA